jgi:transposase
MIGLAPGTKVFLACQPIDLRAGFDGLAAKVQQIIGADPFICVERKYVAALSR